MKIIRLLAGDGLEITDELSSPDGPDRKLPGAQGYTLLYRSKGFKRFFYFFAFRKSDSVQVNLSLCQFLQIFFCLM